MLNLISKLISKLFIKQLFKFACVGAIGTIVNLTILYIFTEYLHVYYIISEIIAFIIAGINNYLLNKIWTFKEKIEKKLLVKYFQFITISSIALIINLSILFILVDYFLIWYIFAEFIAICGAFMINFMGNRIWTFKQEINEINT